MDVYALIGNPVEHSLSPPMHEAAYQECDIDARYVTFEPPADAATAAVESAQTLGVSGLNVTIPFKEELLSAVDPTPLAARIGAVNTVDFSTTPPTGHNTDASGAVRALRQHGVTVDGTALVVGAGGAGRAIGFGLADQGATVTVANRTLERAETVVADLNDTADTDKARAVPLDRVPALLADADILVNATSVGMDEDASPVPADALHSELAVLDAVYSPLSTQLLEAATDAGATTIDGGWMLLYQGVDAFEFWTGVDAPVDAMNAALRARL